MRLWLLATGYTFCFLVYKTYLITSRLTHHFRTEVTGDCHTSSLSTFFQAPKERG